MGPIAIARAKGTGAVLVLGVFALLCLARVVATLCLVALAFFSLSESSWEVPATSSRGLGGSGSAYQTSGRWTTVTDESAVWMAVVSALLALAIGAAALRDFRPLFNHLPVDGRPLRLYLLFIWAAGFIAIIACRGWLEQFSLLSADAYLLGFLGWLALGLIAV